MPCAHRRRMWTGRAEKTTPEGSGALNDDDRRSRTTRNVLNDLDIGGSQEDPTPSNDDASSAAGDDADELRPRVSLRHRHQ